MTRDSTVFNRNADDYNKKAGDRVGGATLWYVGRDDNLPVDYPKLRRPRSMSFYFFYQQEPKSVWIPALADERANILRTKKPALATVLDVDSAFDTDMTADEQNSVRYRGPLYWDMDSEDLSTAIEQSKKLLTLIQSHGVDLNMLRCYLTGGRGVHILMDQVIFMPKVPPTGTTHLPTIFKEMVHSIAYVDDVDMRV